MDLADVNFFLGCNGAIYSQYHINVGEMWNKCSLTPTTNEEFYTLKSKIQHIISVRTKSRKIMSFLWRTNNVLGSIIRNATLLLTQTQCIPKWRRYMNELCHLLCILIWKSVWLNVWSTNLNKWVSFNTVMCI